MGLLRRILSLTEKHLTWLQLITGWSGVTLIGWLSKLAAERTSWIVAHGPYAVWLAALGGAAAAALIWTVIAVGRTQWAKAGAINHWKATTTEALNPLDREFHNKRIKLSDLLSPGGNDVSDKTFTGCQLIGPFNIQQHGGRITHSEFRGCNMVLVRENEFFFTKHVINCVIDNCVLFDCTLFIPEQYLADFKQANPGIPVVGDPAGPVPIAFGPLGNPIV